MNADISNMEYINLKRLDDELIRLKQDFESKTPFHYVVIEDFFHNDKAEEIFQNYPKITDGVWDNTTYIDQKNKFQKTTFADESIFDKVFKELNSEKFVQYLEKLTGIEGIIEDQELFGGGLHQSIKGAFLNVHIDYNVHPKTKYHRRLNLLVYVNKDWKDEYEGHLELWDLTNGKNNLLTKIAPTFNRCVIFETNEISFHGHPEPLRTPTDVTRKSLATYYYTKTRQEVEIAPEHSTIYVNTHGLKGQLKRFSSGMKALFERVARR